jgi:uncharacterized protein
MNLIITLLPLLKVALAFGLMLLGIRLRLRLWLAILAGGLALGLLFGMPLADWPGAALRGVLQAQSLRLAGILGLILTLSECLEKTGQAKRLMDSLAGRLRNPRLRLAFFPVLLGLLPMPGGAVFSAPMVRGMSRDLPIAEQDRALVNYWFRHIWELAWPLYPGLILASSLAGLPIYRLAGTMFMAPALMAGLGWLFILRPGVLPLPPQPAAATAPGAPLGAILREALPLLTVIAGAVGFEALIAAMDWDLDFEVGIMLALGLALATCAAQNRKGFGAALRSLSFGHLGDMLLVVAAIFAFKETLESAGVVGELAQVAGGGAALMAATLLLPLLMGMISGINVAFVGSTFPLILALLGQLGMGAQTLPYVVLGMYAGFTGVMISPIHICFILTCQYFDTPLPAAWRRIAAPCLIFLGFGVLHFLLLRP